MASEGRSGTKTRDPYSTGNSNWNTEKYKKSVRTERTATRVITPFGKETGSYFYDNTPDAVRKRKKAELAKIRTKWKKEAKRNRRLQKFKRVAGSAVIMVLSVTVLFTAVYKLFFKVKTVDITGSSNYSSEEIFEATGLENGDNLFSFSSVKVGDRIKFYCPLVASTDFDRTVPDKLKIDITEEAPTYYAEIYGVCYGVSDSLRLLERIDESEAYGAGMIKLKLQAVSNAVAGEKIKLRSERAQRYLENTVTLLNASDLKEKITSVDLTDDFDLYMASEHRIKLEFGTQEDMDVKIRLASAILKDELFNNENKATVDLRDTSKSSVIIDNQLEVE